MKGLHKLLDAALTFIEENPELAAEGLNEFVEKHSERIEKMIAERKVKE